MGREQGDETPPAVVFVTTDENGEQLRRSAFSPADEVNLRARGWVPENEQHGGRPVSVSHRPAAPVVAGDNEHKDG